MRSVGGQVVVVVLMLLQAAAISGRRPIPPPETTCTTDETTTVTPSPTTTTTATTTPIPTTTTTPIPTTTECPIADCFLIECRTVTGEDGCLACDCSPYNCDNVTCDPGQECVMKVGECNYPTCLSEPSCVTQTSETPPPTRTPTPSCPPPPPFPHYPGCGAYEGPDGCIRIECYTCPNLPWDPTDPMRPNIQTGVITCPEGTTCELQTCWSYPCPPPYICASSTETTTVTTTGPTCEDVSGCPCTLDYSSGGCPTCICVDPPICGWKVQCGPDEECLESPDSENGYACFSIYGPPTRTPTTETTTETSTTACPPIPPYARIPGCGAFQDPDGCMRVRCYTCDDIPPCGEGTTCELQVCRENPCPPPVICVPTTGTTPETTTETTTESTTETITGPTPPACEDMSSCQCTLDYSFGRCPTCVCVEPPICGWRVQCGPDEECLESPDSVYGFACFSIYGTTTEATTETTTETTEETTTGTPPPACEDMSWCTGLCILDYSLGGCPTCNCGDLPSCGWPGCGPEEDCLPSPDAENGFACFSRYGTTTETITETTTSPCEDLSSCTGTCSPYYDGSGGCPTCLCGDPICGWLIQCGPDEECLPSPESEYGFACFSIYADTTTEITTPVCEDMSWCTGGCSPYYDGSGGCPTCLCVDPICGFAVICGPDEECLESPGSEYGFACFSIYGTTTEMTTLACEDMSGCAGSCKPSFEFSTDGCPTCVCDDEICGPILTCGPGEECLPSPGSEYGYACFGTTIETTTETTTWTTTPTTSTDCPIVTCGPNCARNNTPGPDGCDSCECYPNCWDTPCDPGYECVFQLQCPPCFPLATCVPINETTSASPTPTPTDATPITPTKHRCPMVLCMIDCPAITGPDGCPKCVCPTYTCQNLSCHSGDECVMQEVECPPDTTPCFRQPTCVHATTTPCPQIKCARECVSDTGSDGCSFCACPPSCNTVKCSAGHECRLVNVTCIRDPCFPQAQCVPVQDTTTQGCPMYKCAPNCVPDTGSDGCPICACPPTCETVRCSAGHECQLFNVTCIRYPCFPQPQCVQVEDPCTGTPNPGRCGRGSKTRWTYNSLTDTCESFRYYGCTPSPNTFRSRKECKKECNGNSQIICPAFVCEDDCYTFVRRNECQRCICPNPCKGFRCRKGYECKMRQRKCDTEPKPFCAKIADSCPPQDPCGIRCMYGLKKDRNGCQLCECLPEPRSDN